jgi:hypothetical protein
MTAPRWRTLTAPRDAGRGIRPLLDFVSPSGLPARHAIPNP